MVEKEICDLDLMAESVGLSEEGVALRREKFAELRKGLIDRHSLLRQKSRVR